MDSVVLWFGALVIGYFVVRILAKPAVYVSLALGRAAVGYLVLWAVNGIGLLVGLHLPLNGITALIAGILGIPGVAIVYVLSRLYV